jgi:hypothetical protein
MFGGDATQLDAFTLGLLTNAEVLQLNSASSQNRQVQSTGTSVVWVAVPFKSNATAYVALFNTGNSKAKVSVALQKLGITGTSCKLVRDVWTGDAKPATLSGVVEAEVAPTGVVLLALGDCV